MVHELALIGLGLDADGGHAVSLRTLDGDRHLTVPLSAEDRHALLAAEQGLRPAEPLIHDLLLATVSILGRKLLHVTLRGKADRMQALMTFDDAASVVAHPPHGLTLAVRAVVPILAEEHLLS